MKKLILTALLIPLVAFEFVICTSFLPLGWQHAINERIPRVLSESPLDWSKVTHPTMDLEIEEVQRQHLWLRIAAYVFASFILTANTMLIRFVWQRLGTAKSISANRS